MGSRLRGNDFHKKLINIFKRTAGISKQYRRKQSRCQQQSSLDNLKGGP